MFANPRADWSEGWACHASSHTGHRIESSKRSNSETFGVGDLDVHMCATAPNRRRYRGPMGSLHDVRQP